MYCLGRIRKAHLANPFALQTVAEANDSQEMEWEEPELSFLGPLDQPDKSPELDKCRNREACQTGFPINLDLLPVRRDALALHLPPPSLFEPCTSPSYTTAMDSLNCFICKIPFETQASLDHHDALTNHAIMRQITERAMPAMLNRFFNYVIPPRPTPQVRPLPTGCTPSALYAKLVSASTAAQEPRLLPPPTAPILPPHPLSHPRPHSQTPRRRPRLRNGRDRRPEARRAHRHLPDRLPHRRGAHPPPRIPDATHHQLAHQHHGDALPDAADSFHARGAASGLLTSCAGGAVQVCGRGYDHGWALVEARLEGVGDRAWAGCGYGDSDGGGFEGV